MFAVTALSWLGEYVHNLYELPQLSVLSPENSITAVISLALFCVWWLTPLSRAAALLLLGWSLLHLIGGAIISVMPLPFLPFYPEQTLDHYAAHLVYGLAQIPLIVVAIRQLRAPQIQ
jgi:hypothetical protein